MGNNKSNGENRTTDRESVLREIALACQHDGNVHDLFSLSLGILLKHLADSGSIDLVEDDGSITRAMTRDNNGEQQEMLTNHRDGHPMPLTASYGYPRVIKTGKSQFIPGVSERIASRLFPLPPEAELVLDGLLVRSFICVPLIARGHTLGALTLLTTNGNRTLDSDDLLVIEEIAILIAVALDGHAHVKIVPPPR
ncbi:MAG TPA: GAF domain-containing protein [Candidatus Kapabacteria bacterium]|nr:GAF domain-containing protein [Candidatus Kapabacteria bacterium]